MPVTGTGLCAFLSIIRIAKAMPFFGRGSKAKTFCLYHCLKLGLVFRSGQFLVNLWDCEENALPSVQCCSQPRSLQIMSMPQGTQPST